MHEFVKGDRVTYERAYGKTGNTVFNGCIGTVVQGRKMDTIVKWDNPPAGYRNVTSLVHYNYNLALLSLDIPGDNDDDCI